MNQPKLLSSGIKDVQFGKDVTIVEPVNIYEAVIGDNCFIGPFTEIQKNVSIGNRTRVQSHSFICEGVTIGEDCFIAHSVVFINDDFRAGGPASKYGIGLQKTIIGNRVVIGSNASIMPVTICDDVVIGAGSVITENITETGIYAGNPAKKLRNLPSYKNDQH